ncbi:MAG TPA: 4Fe-4S binding protein [Firmicutes bacterium]|nr:4Fe-4S binding protein [Bacillota bacterium]
MILEDTEIGLKELLIGDKASVVIARRACALLKGVKRKPAYKVDKALCWNCNLCFSLGCPAIAVQNKKAYIDESLCNGCGLCAQVCKFGAIGQNAGEGALLGCGLDGKQSEVHGMAQR